MEENDEKQDGEIIATSEFDKIVDNASLLKFCKEKNESEKEFTKEYMRYLMRHITSQLFTKNIKLSIETCYELLIFCPSAEFYFMGYNGKTFLKHIDFGDNNNEKLNSLEQILNFIKSHKQSNENSDVQNYLRLIDFFLGFPIKTCSVNEFLEVMEFNFANKESYNNINKDGFLCVINILSSCIDGDETQYKDAAKVVNDILNSEHQEFYLDKNFIKFTIELLKKLKSQYIDITVDCAKIMNNYFTKLSPERFDFKDWLGLLSGCKDNSVHQGALIKSNQNSLKTAFLPFNDSLREDEISAIKTKYGKCIFTPSLINFIKQKFKFDEDYDLEKVLKQNFEKDNFIEGNNLDLSVIMYRLCFECEQCIPHEKQDIIKLFESTKLFLPEQYECYNGKCHSAGIKEKIDDDLLFTSLTCYKNKIYAELDDFVQQIFIEKGVLQKGEDNNNKIDNEIVNEEFNNNKNRKLTLEELKIIVLSNFKFATEDQPNGITKEKFATLIPDKIYDKYYFKWCLEFYKGKRGISKEDFIFCISRYKFTDINDFNDFCSEISNSHSLYKNARFDLDCVSALLDACDGIDSLKEESASFRYMQEIVSKTKNQKLIDKMNNKFNLQLIKKQNEILTTNNNRLIIENPNLNNAQSKSKTIVNPKSNEGKTPLWIIIITLGGIFWGPWLFKKIFSCCYDFEDTVVPTNETDNQKSSNQNPMPNQDNNLKENLNKGEDEFA